MKLILHVGLPKTGTSALQYLLYSNRKELLRNSILYPDDVVAYRHQFLVSAMFNGDFNAEMIEKHIPSTIAISTIILSAEGLSVHVDRFRKDALTRLRNHIKTYQQANIYIVLRNHESWLKSYYKQCILNPVSIRVVQHETSLVFEEFIRLPQVRKIANYQGLINLIQDKFGIEVSQIAYNKTIVEDLYCKFTNNIKIPERSDAIRENLSISDTAAELARQININFGTGLIRNVLVNLLKLLDLNASQDDLRAATSQLKKLGLKSNDFDRIKSSCGLNPGLMVDMAKAEELLCKIKKLV